MKNNVWLFSPGWNEKWQTYENDLAGLQKLEDQVLRGGGVLSKRALVPEALYEPHYIVSLCLRVRVKSFSYLDGAQTNLVYLRPHGELLGFPEKHEKIELVVF